MTDTDDTGDTGYAPHFAAIREIYAIPRDENRKLRDYPTTMVRLACE